MKCRIKNIFVLGGHKLSATYLTHLIKAKKEGLIHYDHLAFIDPNSHPAALQLKEKPEFIQKTYSDFLVDYLKLFSPDLDNSVIIPDHTAPHVLFQVFIKLIEQLPAKIKILSFDDDLKLPFQKILDSGICAISYATWTCPLECDEPETCPAIKDKRNWDLANTLEEYSRHKKNDLSYSLHFFGCDQLAYGVCQIPLKKIHDEWIKLRSKIMQAQSFKMIVATHSKCHGIIGLAKIF